MKRLFRLLTACIFISALAACGGGGGTDPIANQPATTLSGTAAAGAPIIGQVTVKGSQGHTKTALIEANGNYSVDVTGLTAPYRLRAQGTVGGIEYKLHSYAETADLGNTVNITPFTDLIVANAAGQIASTYFDEVAPTDIPPADLAAQEEALQTKLQAVFTTLGVGTAVDLLHTTFSADHTALDAALDIIRIETDSTSNIATITNVIDNTSITDAILDPSDVSAPLVVNPGLAAAVSARQAIFNTLDSFSALFATALPSSAQLGQLLSDDFLHMDMGKAQTLTEWTTDPTMVGLSFQSVVINAIDEAAGTATVSFNVAFNGVARPTEVETWTLTKASGAWQLRGNQEIVDRWFDYICETSSYGQSCGINLGADDFDPTNNNGAGVLIDSAKVTLMRAGNPVSGGVVYMGVPAGGAAGELRIYDTDYSNDHMAFGSGALQIDSSLFQVGDDLQFELYTAPLDLTNPQAPVVTGTAIATYSTPITTVPVTMADSPTYPSATQATLTAFNAYTTEGGNLTVGWTIPTGQAIDEVMFQVCNNSTCLDEWKWLPTGSEATLSIDTSSLSLADAPYRTELRVYSADPQGRTFLTTYLGTANASGSGTTPPAAGFTAQMLDASPTYYVTYPGNFDGTITGGTTQESLVVSGSGPYTVTDTVDYFDANGLFVSSTPLSGTFVLNTDGTLTATINGLPGQSIMTLTTSTTTYLGITGTDNTGSWSDFWYFAPPASWLSTQAPTVFTAPMLDAISTVYIQYPADDPAAPNFPGGTTQEVITMSGSNGSYQLSFVSSFFDASGAFLSSETGQVAATLGQGGTLSATYTDASVTPAVDVTISWALQSDNGTTLVVNGSDNSGTWQNVWNLNTPPSGWL
ncbi:hypothetical protein [Geopsychrobacter electrodiphilus]|uniref:hypothetical protein n=1 Tax=Geopsychrobacter electrodiphilus TaxID=225196 RepID=UPI000373A3C0|nr:hypothetical protein [Geopsychrobacter electrodiphilus]